MDLESHMPHASPYVPRYKFPEHAGHDLMDLVNKMLQKEPGARLPLDDVEEHDWMKDLTSGDSAVAL